jgi:Protein of unknown function (DUF1579)
MGGCLRKGDPQVQSAAQTRKLKPETRNPKPETQREEGTMMKRLVGSALAVLAIGSLVLAQAPPAAKPGPQHKSMGYFVGKWKSEVDIKPGVMGPGGKMTSTDSCEWFAGSFHVVCRSEGSGAMGNMTSMGVLGWSDAHKAYTYYGADSMGTNEFAQGQKKGNTWTFTSTSTVAGKSFQSRYTIVETSPTVQTFKWEASEDKKTWNVVMEGKSTKM